MSNITLKGSLIHTNGTPPKLKSAAIDFSLITTDLQTRSLQDYANKNLILSIVPSLDTPVCLTSAKKFETLLNTQNNLTMLFISADLPFALKRVCGMENLKKLETLSMMCNPKFAEDYGVLMIDGPLKGLAARAIIALNEHHQVIYTELVPEISQEPNYEAVFNLFS